MPKLSTNYRNDSSEGLDPELRAYLDGEYIPRLQNLAVPHPKLLVVFSGGNAMGKTTIARKIEAQFKAVVLENDEIKRCILQRIPGAGRDVLSPLTWQYSMDLYARLSGLTQNGLIVRDGVIDWYYDRILPVFLDQGYQLFVIGFDVSRAKAEELILRRGNTPTTSAERLCQLFEDHAIHNKRFRSEYPVDILLRDQTLFDHDAVLQALAARLDRFTADADMPLR